MFEYLDEDDKDKTLVRFMQTFDNLTPPETPEIPHQHQAQKGKDSDPFYFSFGKKSEENANGGVISGSNSKTTPIKIMGKKFAYFKS